MSGIIIVVSPTLNGMKITDKIDNNKHLNKRINKLTKQFNFMSKISSKTRYTQLMEWLPTVKKKQAQTTNKPYHGSKRK